MPSWITDIQGYTTVLDAAGNPVQRRKAVQVLGATVTDNGTNTVIAVPSGPTGPSGATGAAGGTAGQLRGPGLTVVGSTLVPRIRPRYLQLQDYFVSGNNTTGQIGALGWNLRGTNATIAVQSGSDLSDADKIRLASETVSGSEAILGLGLSDSTGDSFTTADILLLQTIVRPVGGLLTTSRYAFGLFSDTSVDPAALPDGLVIYYDSAVSANWQCLTRSGSAGTPTVTTTAVTTSAVMLTIHQPTLNTIDFYVGNTLVATRTTNLSAAGMQAAFRAEPLGGVSRGLEIGYFGLVSHPIAGVYDDDAFLEV